MARKNRATKDAPASAQASGPCSAFFATRSKSLDHDHQHRRFHAEKQRGYKRHGAVERVDRPQCQHDHRAGNDEQTARQQPAPHPVQAPAGISGQLHGFRPGQQHAEGERTEELLFGQPAVLFHQHLVH